MATISNSGGSVDIGLKLRTVLESDGGEIYDGLRSYFKAGAVKNILSRRKPVPLNVKKCQDYDSTKYNYYAEWWKGSDGMCGINIPNLGSSESWSYNPPAGTEESPFRMNDFLGYATTAEIKEEMFSFVLPRNLREGSSLDIPLVISSGSEWILSLADIFDLVCLRLNCGGMSITKEVSTLGGTHQITFNPSELASVGAVGGSEASIEVFGKKNGVEKSLKYADDITTIKPLLILAALPYYPDIIVVPVSRNPDDPTLLNIPNIGLILAGRTPEGENLDGGTLAQSALGIYLHNGDFHHAFENGYYYMVSLMEVPSLTVEPGGLVRHRFGDMELVDYAAVSGFMYRRISFMWFELSNGGEIATTTLDIL